MEPHKLQNVSSVLRSLNWQFVTHVPENPTAPIFKGQAVIYCHEMSVTNDQSTLRNTPEERHLIYTAAEA